MRWSALHLSDDYRVTHNQGVWLAVADAARQGQLYPPIFDGEHYAGTRYMPLPILLNGFAAGLVGDPLVGVKLLAAVLMATLLAIVIFVLRQVLVSLARGSDAGCHDRGHRHRFASWDQHRRRPPAYGVADRRTGGRIRWSRTAAPGDSRRPRRFRNSQQAHGRMGGSAVTTWLVMTRQRHTAALFAAVCVGTASLSLGAVQVMSNGGLSQHLLAFSVAGVHGGGSLLRGPNQVLYNLLGHAWSTVVLLPIAALGVLLPGRSRQISIFHIALAYALLLLVITYADVGTGFNHLLDVVVLTALAVGDLAGRATSVDRPAAAVLSLAVLVSVVWAAGLDLVRTVGFDVRGAVVAATSGRPATRAAIAAAGIVKPQEEVLAEDPSIYIALRRQPVVMDPFMVMRLDSSSPAVGRAVDREDLRAPVRSRGSRRAARR